MARMSLGASLGWIFVRGSRIEALQDAMEISGPSLVGARAQAFAQFVGTLRAGEQAFQQSAQVKAGAADHDGQDVRALQCRVAPHGPGARIRPR